MRTNCIGQKFSLRVGAAIALAGCLLIPGSVALAQDTTGAPQQGARSDGDIQSRVASALANDQALQNQQIKAYTSNGVVTLTGTVQNEQQRQEAETIAAGVQGVSGIQNNLNVADETDQTQAPPPPAESQQPAQTEQVPPNTQQSQSQAPAAAQQLPPPPPPDQAAPRAPYQPQGGYGQQPYSNYPAQQGYNNYPPQQTSGPVTIPAGTLLQVRISEPLDIARLQDGATFQATAASDVFEGNVLAIPRGAVLEGTVVKVKKPGALGGSGELQLQITSVNMGGRIYPVATDLWTNKGPNKAGYTAGNTAGGAIAGAIIGGILGRGPGAAIGAVAGGGAGMAASAATNGPRLYLPAESLLNFHLSSPVTVQPVSWQEAQRLAQNAPRLQRRPVYMAPPYPYGYPYPYPYRVYYGW